MKKLLLTGFEPFGGSEINPSEQAALFLDGQTLNGIQIRSVILPVAHQTSTVRALEAIDRIKPDFVLSLGEANRRPGLSVERVAINLLDYAAPDNQGNQIIDQKIVADGPAAYFATLPVHALVEAIEKAGVPAELSLSAGAFLCNQVMYAVLHHIATQKLNIPAGFIHLPALPVQVSKMTNLGPSMSLETILTGIRAAITALG